MSFKKPGGLVLHDSYFSVFTSFSGRQGRQYWSKAGEKRGRSQSLRSILLGGFMVR